MKRTLNKLTGPLAPLAALVAYAVFALTVVHNSASPMIDAVKAMS